MIFGAALCVLGPAWSEDKNKKGSLKPSKEAVPQSPADSSQLPDSPGIRLAQSELPELSLVLSRLKQRSPGQFDKAMKDLDRAAKRLDALKQREPSLYDSAIAEWRMRATLDLLKAKHKAKPSKESEAAIAKQQEAIRVIRIQQIKKELTALAAREKLLNEKIKQAEQSLQRGEQRRQQLQAELDKSTSNKERAESTESTRKESAEKPTKSKPSKSQEDSREQI